MISSRKIPDGSIASRRRARSASNSRRGHRGRHAGRTKSSRATRPARRPSSRARHRIRNDQRSRNRPHGGSLRGAPSPTRTPTQAVTGRPRHLAPPIPTHNRRARVASARDRLWSRGPHQRDARPASTIVGPAPQPCRAADGANAFPIVTSRNASVAAKSSAERPSTARRADQAEEPCPRVLDHLAFLVDPDNFGDVCPHRERDLASTARDVEDSPGPVKRRARHQVADQVRRIREATPVVERRGPSIQIGPELHLFGHHSAHPITAQEADALGGIRDHTVITSVASTS